MMRTATSMHNSGKNVSVPSHIAIIPDGNRRWSKGNKLSLLNGYKNGVEKFIAFSLWAKVMGVKTLTFWALSTENIANRSKMELSTLYGLYLKAATDPKLLALLIKNSAKVRVIGNMQMIPSKLSKALIALERKTNACKELTINLLIGYGGKEDLTYAVQPSRNGDVNSKDFGKRIRSSTLPEVDLVIRTSGEHRLSGLLPWQTSYSEIYFSRKFWPDFERRDLRRAINSYSNRERRFGK